MARVLSRSSDVQAILDFGFTKFCRSTSAAHCTTTASRRRRAHRDVIFGHWLHIDPRTGHAGVRELRRCIDRRVGFLGFGVSGLVSPPASDPIYEPFYELCIEAEHPGADLRRLHRARRRPARRRRHHPRPLPSAPSRLRRRESIPNSRSSPAVPPGRGRTR